MEPLNLLMDALTADAVAPRLRDLDAAGDLTRLLPELEEGRSFAQPELHYYDVLDHNMAAVAALDVALGDGTDGQELREAVAWADLDASLTGTIEGLPLIALLRLGALIHDVAKPRTATIVDGRLRFPRHGPRGAELISERLPLLGFGPGATEFVSKLARYHLRPRELVRTWPVTDRAVRRFTTDLDGHVLPLMLINLADGMATRGPGYTREQYRRHCTFVNYVAARAWAAFEPEKESERPLLTGDDLIAELHLESGRLVGAVLTSIRKAQLDGTISNRDAAVALAHTVLATMRAEPS